MDRAGVSKQSKRLRKVERRTRIAEFEVLRNQSGENGMFSPYIHRQITWQNYSRSLQFLKEAQSSSDIKNRKAKRGVITILGNGRYHPLTTNRKDLAKLGRKLPS